MAVYGNLFLTQAGLALNAKVQAGTQLNFTRMQIGSGQLASGQDPTTLAALISPIAYFPINSVSSNGDIATVKGVFENTNIVAATYSCEIGLFSTDPTVGEILYAYVTAGTQGDTIPPNSAGPLAKLFQLDFSVGNTTNITAMISANTYIPVTEIGVAGGVASLDQYGQVPAAQLKNIPPVNASSGATLGTVELPLSAGSPATPVVPYRAASVKEYLLADTNLDNVLTFTPASAGNFLVAVSVRIVTAQTPVTIQITWTDASGTLQTDVRCANAPVATGPYDVPIKFINANADPITVQSQAGTANRIYVSASIVGV